MRLSKNRTLFVALFGTSCLLACTPGTEGAGASGPGMGGSDAGGSNTGAGTLGGQAPGGSTGDFNPSGGSPPTNNCDSGPTEDADMDGFTGDQGDCNDCDANVNPGAIEVIGTADGTGGGGGSGEYVPADEDCDGTADNVAPPCDSALALEGTDPMDAARAIELCKTATGPQDWGVVNAAWVRANGTPASANLQVGIMDDFGPNVLPRAGARLLGVSSGNSRTPTDAGYNASTPGQNTFSATATAPPGFPQAVPNCGVANDIHDDAALELSVRAPTNATGYHFDFKFYSYEYPEWVCNIYNDQFIALVNPAPMGSQNGNISFDSNGSPVSVNIAFFDVCSGCAAGTAELDGTGFNTNEGGTSWLQTTAPIAGGETFSIRFAIWDTGDQYYDSTSVIDNFQWVATGGTVTVGTTPVPQ